MRRVLPTLVLVGALSVSGCTNETPFGGSQGECQSECQVGEACVDGKCEATSCAHDHECEWGSACVHESCCARERACDKTCCAQGFVCFADTCIVAGDVCIRQTDCDVDQYCEPALGTPTSPPSGEGVCLSPPPTGRCVDLPAPCTGSEPAGTPCARECEYRPDVGVLSAVPQWTWGVGDSEIVANAVDVWSTPVVGRIYDTNCDGTVDFLDPPNIVFVSGDLQIEEVSPGVMVGKQCGTIYGENVLCKRGVLRVLDGRTGTELLSIESAESGSLGFAGSSVALGDVDHDGTAEIVAMTGEGYIVVVEGDGSIKAISDAPFDAYEAGPACVLQADCPLDSKDRQGYACIRGVCVARSVGWGGGLTLGDMNGDGNIEVAMGATLWTVAADGTSVTRAWWGTQGGLHQGRPITYFADIGEDANLELIAGHTAYRFDGTTMWDRADLGVEGFSGVADFDGNGTPEVVYVQDGQIAVLDGSTGTTLIDPVLVAGTGSGGPPTIADFDGDGLPEIGVAKADYYSVHDVNLGALTITELWATANHDLSSSVTGSTVFDFEGDGIAEVVYNDECFLWVYDGPTGDIRFAHPTSSFTATEASIVADVDGDGRAEMVMVANGADPRSPEGWDCDTPPWNQADVVNNRPAWVPPSDGLAWRGLVVFRDSANGWVGTRPLWNQHSYSVSNVCEPGDDACDPTLPHGGIPTRQRKNWQVPWLNNFRQNVQDEGIFDAPDAAVLVAGRCWPYEVVVTVRNLGEAVLPQGVVVQLFFDDGAGETLFATLSTDWALLPGQSQELTVAVPDGTTPTRILRARIINDPLDPTFRECFEDNNEAESLAPDCSSQ